MNSSALLTTESTNLSSPRCEPHPGSPPPLWMRPVPQGICWLLLVVVLAYHLIGVLPVAPTDGDSQGVATGVQQSADGIGGIELGYNREVQPGMYALGILLRKTTGMDSYALMTYASATAVVAYVLLASLLAQRLARLPAGLCGATAILLFPETLADAYFPNSTVIAALLGLAGLMVAWRTRGAWGLAVSGALLGVAVSFRIDIILTMLAAVALLYRGSWRGLLARMSLLGGVAAAVASVTIYACGSSIPQILAAMSRHYLKQVPPPDGSLLSRLMMNSAVQAHMTFFPVLTVFLIVLGLYVLARDKRWHVLAIVLLGAAPLYGAYFLKLTTPRYFYYDISFLAVACLYAMREVLRMKPTRAVVVVALMACMFLGQYVIGLRITPQNKPWWRDSSPTLVTLYDRSFPSGPLARISVVIGVGLNAPSDAGIRYAGGILFSPLAWRYEKQRALDAQAALDALVVNQKQDELILGSLQYGAMRTVRSVLLRNGFVCKESVALPDGKGELFPWTRDGLTILHAHEELADPTDGVRAFDALANSRRQPHFVLVAIRGREPAWVAQSGRPFERIYECSQPNAFEISLLRLSTETSHTPGN